MSHRSQDDARRSMSPSQSRNSVASASAAAVPAYIAIEVYMTRAEARQRPLHPSDLAVGGTTWRGVSFPRLYVGSVQDEAPSRYLWAGITVYLPPYLR